MRSLALSPDRGLVVEMEGSRVLGADGLQALLGERNSLFRHVRPFARALAARSSY